jgi:hypothetical protein
MPPSTEQDQRPYVPLLDGIKRVCAERPGPHRQVRHHEVAARDEARAAVAALRRRLGSLEDIRRVALRRDAIEHHLSRRRALTTWKRDTLTALRARGQSPIAPSISVRRRRDWQPKPKRKASSVVAASGDDPPPRRREALRRRAASVAFRGYVDRLALTVERFYRLTPDFAGPERLIVFGWLPTRSQDEFYDDVQRLANLDPAREGWQA